MFLMLGFIFNMATQATTQSEIMMPQQVLTCTWDPYFLMDFGYLLA